MNKQFGPELTAEGLIEPEWRECRGLLEIDSLYMPAQDKSDFLLYLATTAFVVILAATGFLILGRARKLPPPGEPSKIEMIGRLVPDFPELSVYPGATLVSSYQKQDGAKFGYEANWEVDATVDEIMAWYIEVLSEFDWVVEEEPEDVEGTYDQSLIAERDNTRVYLTVEREKGVTKINAEFPVQ